VNKARRWATGAAGVLCVVVSTSSVAQGTTTPLPVDAIRGKVTNSTLEYYNFKGTTDQTWQGRTLAFELVLEKTPAHPYQATFQYEAVYSGGALCRSFQGRPAKVTTSVLHVYDQQFVVGPLHAVHYSKTWDDVMDNLKGEFSGRLLSGSFSETFIAGAASGERCDSGTVTFHGQRV